MVSLPLSKDPTRGEAHGCGTTCGTNCGAGLEKIFPTTAVRFSAMNWIGEFAYRPGTTFRCGAKVVIETDRGIELGQQVSLSCNGCSKQVTRDQIQAYIQNSGPEFYKLNSGRILREATDQDISEQEHLNGHLHDDIDTCALLAAQLELEMKIVTAEHLLGGERIVFYFMAEQRIDFRALVKELAHQFRTRIEMRQVGPRDEARLVADYEICGRECCCKTFLKKLRPVNMKMAKVQKSTLDPSKVSGRCGRLRCCLRYEHEGYEELAAKLPNVNSRVDTAFGTALVLDRQILTQLLLVRTEDDRQMTIPLEEIKGILPALPRPPEGSPVRSSPSDEGAERSRRTGQPGEVERSPDRRRGDRFQRGQRPVRPLIEPAPSGEPNGNPEAERANPAEPARPVDGRGTPPGGDVRSPDSGGASSRRRRRRRTRPNSGPGSSDHPGRADSPDSGSGG